MLKNFLFEQLQKAFEFDLTTGQMEAMQALSDFISSHKTDHVFILKGYAGTGKTSLIATLVKVLKTNKSKSIMLAPTGRAAKVISTYANKTAYTIHKKIYRQKRLRT